MLTKNEIYEIALRQSAVDQGCAPEDYLRTENVVVRSRPHPAARKYLELPFSCDLVCYGGNIVAAVGEGLERPVRSYIDRYPREHCFETPNLHVFDAALAPFGQQSCWMAEYFLPVPALLPERPCALETRLLGPDAFAPLYRPEWSNALCEKRRELDVLGVGAYDGGALVGLAACSADCETMWQIGIDVLPAYRRRGLASALTARLAREILRRGKAPFYCAAWSNIGSVRNAVASGFRPAWVELTAKSIREVAERNR